MGSPNTNLPVPTVHLNGTGGESLIRQLRDAYSELLEAKRTLAQAYPHGRDYYVQAGDALERAKRLHDGWHESITKICDEIFEVYEAVQEQVNAREGC